MTTNDFQTLVNAMSIDEKISMLHGATIFKTAGVERLGIPPLIMSDGPMGVRQEFPDNSWTPLGGHDDYVTAFPCNIALAATWNKDLAYDYGDALGAEARGRGKDVILAPGINIIRTPLCGRNFEYMSEDPYLTGEMAVPLIKGVQENDVAACVKHYALNNQETKRLYVNVEVDDRTMHEIYLPAFKKAVMDGNVYSIMAAYNLVRGSYCCESPLLLDDILRKQWQFDGIVISDWGATHSCAPSINAGLDIEMSVSTDFDNYWFGDNLKKAVEKNQVDMDRIDTSVLRILKVMDNLNMLKDANIKPTRQAGSYNTPTHQKISQEVAEESIVLLHNRGNLLPIDKEAISSIAVIGDNGDKLHCNAGGSAEVKSLYEITPLAGIKMALGGNHKVTYVKGYTSDEKASIHDQNFLMEEAMKAAGTHDLVIFVGGLNHDFDTEGKDRESLTLPFAQDKLLKAIARFNKNLIVVNISGSPVDLSTADALSGALIQSWYNGIHGGTALANILFGECAPCGRLPVTFPHQLSDCGAHATGEFPGDDTVYYNDGIMVGYRHFVTKNITPQYAFGHGLSYTDFTYSDLILSLNKEQVAIEFKLTNTGDTSAKEVAQIYVGEVNPTTIRPTLELKGFVKIALEPKTSQVIRLSLPIEAFGFYDSDTSQWTTNPGDYKIAIGASSVDIRLKGTVN